MSYSLALDRSGDLVPRGASLGIVYGVNKLVQDLTVWLTESFGGDIMHPELGTVLSSWIGNVITRSTETEVKTEINRVLKNYQDVQKRGMKANPQKYSLSEILYAVGEIQVRIDYDTVNVLIPIQTAPPKPQTANIVIKASANK